MEDGKLYLTLTGPIEDASIAQITQFIEETIDQQNITHLYLSINTPGGSVNAGIAFYHYLRGLPITVTTHNVGQVDSIGSVIFLAGEERIASSATSFHLHGVSRIVLKDAVLKKTDLDEILSQITQDETRIETITTERTKLKKSELSKFFTSGKSLGPKEALEYGIVTEIREFKVPSGAKRGVINTFPAPNQGNIPQPPSI